jgi:hypothetical protein
MERAADRVVTWMVRHPVQASLAAGAMFAGGMLTETALYEFKATDNNQPAHVSHIDAGPDGTVKMESGAALRSMAEKNQGIGIRDNNHNREEIPKFLLDHVDDIAATKGIIFIEIEQSMNENIKKFYADGDITHLKDFHFGPSEVRDTYLELFQKCREKGVEILCYDTDPWRRDERAQEYYSSPHYRGAGPRRGEEDSFPTSVPPELKEGESIFLAERIADNKTMADFVRDTLAERGNPTDCTVYFVCGSYHFANPELPRIETTKDWVRSTTHPWMPTRVAKDLDEQIADILPPGPRKGVVNLDTSLPDKDHIPNSPGPVKYTLVKSAEPPFRFGYDTPEFTLKLPDAVFNRYLASPALSALPDKERTEALTSIKDSFVLLAKMETLLSEEFIPKKALEKRTQQEHMRASAAGDMQENIGDARKFLTNGDMTKALDSVRIIGSLVGRLNNETAAKEYGLSEGAKRIVSLGASLSDNANRFGNIEALATLNLPTQNVFVPSGPATGHVTDLSALPESSRKGATYYFDDRAMPALENFKTLLPQPPAFAGVPKEKAVDALIHVNDAISALRDRRFQDFEFHFRAFQDSDVARALSIEDFNKFGYTLGDVSKGCRHITNGQMLLAEKATAPEVVLAKTAPEVAPLPAAEMKELDAIRATMLATTGGTPEKPPEPPQRTAGFADRFVEERRHPTPSGHQQTNGRTL